MFDYISQSYSTFSKVHRWFWPRSVQLSWVGSGRHISCTFIVNTLFRVAGHFSIRTLGFGKEAFKQRTKILSAEFLHVASHRGTEVEVEISRQEHVFDDGLCGHFSQESDEEKLFYHRGGDSAEWGKSEEELPKPGGLVGVLGPAVLLQGALGLLLQLLYHGGGGQAYRVWKYFN